MALSLVRAGLSGAVHGDACTVFRIQLQAPSYTREASWIAFQSHVADASNSNIENMDEHNAVDLIAH